MFMKYKKRITKFSVILLIVLLCGTSGSAAWKNTPTGKKYTTSSGKYVKSKWMKIKKKWYYFDERGNLKTGRIKVGNDYYYVKSTTGKVCKKKIGSYYYGADGKMVVDTWKKIGKYKFYFDKKGKARYGKIKVNGKYYYCSKKTGKATSRWVNKNYYDKTGVMAVNRWVNNSYVNHKGMIVKGDRNPKNPPTESEVRWLAAITYLEAGNQSYYGKKCVASVVVNRVKSKRFPNTIKSVLFQSGQFTPAGNGSLTRLYNSKKQIQSQCVKAARYVLEHGSVLKGYYFFNTYSGSLKIGEHYFG